MTDLEIVKNFCTQAGGVKELAFELGVSRQTIWSWKHEKEISQLGRFLVSRYARKKRVSLPSDFMERGE